NTKRSYERTDGRYYGQRIHLGLRSYDSVPGRHVVRGTNRLLRLAVRRAVEQRSAPPTVLGVDVLEEKRRAAWAMPGRTSWSGCPRLCALRSPPIVSGG